MGAEEEREAPRQQTAWYEALAHLERQRCRQQAPFARAKSHLPAGDGGGEGRGQGGGAAVNEVEGHRRRTGRQDRESRGRAEEAAGDNQKVGRQGEVRGDIGRGIVRRRGTTASGSPKGGRRAEGSKGRWEAREVKGT